MSEYKNDNWKPVDVSEYVNAIEKRFREKIAQEFENSGRQFWGNADVADRIRNPKPIVNPKGKTSWGGYPPPTKEGPDVV